MTAHLNCKAYAVIGCKIAKDQVSTKEKITASVVSSTHKNHEFIVQKDVYIEGFNEGMVSYKGFDVITSCDKKYFYVGYAIGDGTGINGKLDQVLHVENGVVERLKKELHCHLDPLKLWQDDNFGLWAVLHCS